MTKHVTGGCPFFLSHINHVYPFNLPSYCMLERRKKKNGLMTGVEKPWPRPSFNVLLAPCVCWRASSSRRRESAAPVFAVCKMDGLVVCVRPGLQVCAIRARDVPSGNIPERQPRQANSRKLPENTCLLQRRSSCQA